MSQFTKDMIKKGYVKLQAGSYRIWISKRWHEMFVRRGLVHRNFYGQFSPYKDSLAEFGKWLDLYDKLCHDRDYPRSNPFLSTEEVIEIRQVVT